MRRESGLIFLSGIALVAVAHFWLRLGEVPAFWMAYVLTRPFGASMGDYLTQSRHDGGLGFSTNVVSLVFVAAIAAVVTYLSWQDNVARASVETLAVQDPMELAA